MIILLVIDVISLVIVGMGDWVYHLFLFLGNILLSYLLVSVFMPSDNSYDYSTIG